MRDEEALFPHRVFLYAALGIVRMKQVMAFLAVRFAQIRFVNFGESGVVLRCAHGKFGIVGINSCGTHGNDFVGIEREGLSAAIDASIGAGHDLDDVVLFFARADVFADFFRIGKSVNLAQIERDSGDGKGGFADTFASAHVVEFEIASFLTGEFFCRVSENRFGNAACDAEDDAASGFETERIVALNVGEIVERFNASFADHGAQFDRRHAEIDVANAIV